VVDVADQFPGKWFAVSQRAFLSRSLNRFDKFVITAALVDGCKFRTDCCSVATPSGSQIPKILIE
jgi:hypothetical protein